MLARMTIRTRLIAAFVLVFTLVFTLAFVSGMNASKLDGIIANYGKRKIPAMEALLLMRQAETGVRADGAVLANARTPPEFRAEAAKRLAAALERMAQGEADYAALPHGKKTTALFASYKGVAEKWRREIAAFRAAVDQRDRAAGAGAANVATFEQFVNSSYVTLAHEAVPVSDAVKKLVAQTIEDAAALEREATETTRVVRVTLWGATAMIALVLLAMAFLLTKTVSGAIRGLLSEAGKLTAAVKSGQLKVRGEAAVVGREFQPIVMGMNDTIDAFVKPIEVTADYVDRIAKGNLPPKITDQYEGDFNLIKENLNRCIDAVNALVADATRLSHAAVDGKLSTRADASRHEGDYRKIVQGVNETLDAVVNPISASARILERLAQRDLKARVEGSYQGDHARIKDALNATAEALHESMAQVAQAVEQVSSAAGQIAASSEAVAAGASEQASSLEETSASLESMASMAKHAADNAQQANGLAQGAEAAATEGSAAMEQMTAAMGKIKASAEGTSQIIKDINEIAFQTNLLALNAAVEAARAGEAGRGFAVVAEEVRSLALRSKEAANKTEELIRQSVKEAGEGEVTAKHVNEKLAGIAVSVTKVNGIIAEIAATAKEQTAGIDQVTKAVMQMNQVTQQNAASSEESSSAAAELSGQSEELAAMVATFQLNRGGAAARQAVTKHAGAVAKVAKPKANGHGDAQNGKNGTTLPVSPAAVIPLDGDATFANF